MKTLVVWYSRTGHTRALGRRIADALGAAVEEIHDRQDRSGILGYLRSGADGWFRRRADILAPRYAPERFDLVVIGTPVWRMSLSSPVRTYLEDHEQELGRVAFFCTMDWIGSDRVFRQMQEACGRVPAATLARSARQLAAKDLDAAVAAFAARLGAGRTPGREDVLHA